MIYTA
jgi:hypothetical protein